MCILSYIPANTDLSTLAINGLLNGGINNADGHGWAIADPEYNTIITGHSLDVEDALADFIEARDKHSAGPALFHSRWATHGSIKLANCHPFPVNGSSKTVLAHNGILPAEAHPEKDDDRSDTRILADDILPKWYSRLDNRRTRQNLARWAGGYNKLLILTVDPKYRRNIYLVNENAGNWDHKTGIWHSNYDYTDSWMTRWTKTASGTTTTTTTTSDGWPVTIGTSRSTDTCKLGSDRALAAAQSKDYEIVYDAQGNELCVFCDGKVNAMNHYCTSCGSCADCFEHLSDCLCGGTGSNHNSPVKLNLATEYKKYWADSSNYDWS